MLAAASGSATGASNLKVQQAPSADHQASWMRAQQLSGDGIQIMVNDVDLGQGNLTLETLTFLPFSCIFCLRQGSQVVSPSALKLVFTL